MGFIQKNKWIFVFISLIVFFFVCYSFYSVNGYIEGNTVRCENTNYIPKDYKINKNQKCANVEFTYIIKSLLNDSTIKDASGIMTKLKTIYYGDSIKYKDKTSRLFQDINRVCYGTVGSNVCLNQITTSTIDKSYLTSNEKKMLSNLINKKDKMYGIKK